jgi:segregation and condensation protein B
VTDTDPAPPGDAEDGGDGVGTMAGAAVDDAVLIGAAVDDAALDNAAIDDAAIDDAALDSVALDDADIDPALEAILLVVDAPATDESLAAAVGRGVAEVREHLRAIADQLSDARSGIDLREFGGGWRFYTRDVYAPVVERFVMDGTQTRLSKAALETLAVVAYRQPVTRARISAVRGVNVDGVVRTLLTRGLIQELGAEGESGAVLYGTTDYFLQRLGLGSLDELPALAPYHPEVDVLDELAEQGRA